MELGKTAGVHLAESLKGLAEEIAVMVQFFSRRINDRFQLEIFVVLFVLHPSAGLIIVMWEVPPGVLRVGLALLFAVVGVSQHSDNNYNSIPFASTKYCH
jgi:hypothetical protein